MKKLIAFLLCFTFIFGYACGESPATPTDLYEEFNDNDFGYIDENLLQRQVFLQWLKEPTYYGEEVTVIAILVNFKPTDIYTFQWEYSLDAEEWNVIENEHEQTYTFILDHKNSVYWLRVLVILED